MDIVFVLDASGSIGAPNFDLLRAFINETVASVEMPTTRAGLVVFSNYARTEFGLTRYTSAPPLQAHVKGVVYTGGSTATHLAIDSAVNLFAAEGRSTYDAVPRLMIILTDGDSDSKPATAAAAARARQQHISIAVAAVGAFQTNSNAQAELTSMVGGEMRLLLSVDAFAKLNAAGRRDYVRQLTTLACNEPARVEVGVAAVKTDIFCGRSVYLLYVPNATYPVSLSAGTSSLNVSLCASWATANPFVGDVNSTCVYGARDVATGGYEAALSMFPMLDAGGVPKPGLLYVALRPVVPVSQTTCQSAVIVRSTFCSVLTAQFFGSTFPPAVDAPGYALPVTVTGSGAGAAVSGPAGVRVSWAGLPPALTRVTCLSCGVVAEARTVKLNVSGPGSFDVAATPAAAPATAAPARTSTAVAVTSGGYTALPAGWAQQGLGFNMACLQLVKTTAAPTPSTSPSRSVTATASPSRSVTASSTPSVSGSASGSPSETASPSGSASASRSPSSSSEATRSPTPSSSRSPTASLTSSRTATGSPTASSTPSSSASATTSRSRTPSASGSVTPSQTPSRSTSPSRTPSSSRSPSGTPSRSPSSSATPSASVGAAWLSGEFKVLPPVRELLNREVEDDSGEQEVPASKLSEVQRRRIKRAAKAASWVRGIVLVSAALPPVPVVLASTLYGLPPRKGNAAAASAATLTASCKAVQGAALLAHNGFGATAAELGLPACPLPSTKAGVEAPAPFTLSLFRASGSSSDERNAPLFSQWVLVVSPSSAAAPPPSPCFEAVACTLGDADRRAPPVQVLVPVVRLPTWVPTLADIVTSFVARDGVVNVLSTHASSAKPVPGLKLADTAAVAQVAVALSNSLTGTSELSILLPPSQTGATLIATEPDTFGSPRRSLDVFAYAFDEAVLEKMQANNIVPSCSDAAVNCVKLEVTPLRELDPSGRVAAATLPSRSALCSGKSCKMQIVLEPRVPLCAPDSLAALMSIDMYAPLSAAGPDVQAAVAAVCVGTAGAVPPPCYAGAATAYPPSSLIALPPGSFNNTLLGADDDDSFEGEHEDGRPGMAVLQMAASRGSGEASAPVAPGRSTLQSGSTIGNAAGLARSSLQGSSVAATNAAASSYRLLPSDRTLQDVPLPAATVDTVGAFGPFIVAAAPVYVGSSALTAASSSSPFLLPGVRFIDPCPAPYLDVTVFPGVCANASDPRRAACAWGEGSHCAACPTEAALCPGGAALVPLPGYWVPNPASSHPSEVVACAPPATLRCPGGVSRDGASRCGTGYQAGTPACSACEAGYFEAPDGSCSACPATDPAATLNAGLVLGGIYATLAAALAFLVAAAHKARPGNDVGATLRHAAAHAFALLMFLQVLLQSCVWSPALPAATAHAFDWLQTLQFVGLLPPAACVAADGSGSLLARQLVSLGVALSAVVALGVLAGVLALLRASERRAAAAASESAERSAVLQGSNPMTRRRSVRAGGQRSAQGTASACRRRCTVSAALSGVAGVLLLFLLATYGRTVAIAYSLLRCETSVMTAGAYAGLAGADGSRLVAAGLQAALPDMRDCLAAATAAGPLALLSEVETPSGVACGAVLADASARIEVPLLGGVPGAVCGEGDASTARGLAVATIALLGMGLPAALAVWAGACSRLRRPKASGLTKPAPVEAAQAASSSALLPPPPAAVLMPSRAAFFPAALVALHGIIAARGLLMPQASAGAGAGYLVVSLVLLCALAVAGAKAPPFQQAAVMTPLFLATCVVTALACGLVYAAGALRLAASGGSAGASSVHDAVEGLGYVLLAALVALALAYLLALVALAAKGAPAGKRSTAVAAPKPLPDPSSLQQWKPNPLGLLSSSKAAALRARAVPEGDGSASGGSIALPEAVITPAFAASPRPLIPSAIRRRIDFSARAVGVPSAALGAGAVSLPLRPALRVSLSSLRPLPRPLLLPPSMPLQAQVVSPSPSRNGSARTLVVPPSGLSSPHASSRKLGSPVLSRAGSAASLGLAQAVVAPPEVPMSKPPRGLARMVSGLHLSGAPAGSEGGAASSPRASAASLRRDASGRRRSFNPSASTEASRRMSFLRKPFAQG